MSLRAYFDTALKPGGTKESAQQRRTALGMTVKKGADANRHIAQAQESLKKLRAQQSKRQKACA